MAAPFARLVPRSYHSTGRAFFLVRCDACLVLLNSAHHYDGDDTGRAHAEKLADDHNRKAHS